MVRIPPNCHRFTPIYSKFTFSKLRQTCFNPAYRRVSHTWQTGNRNNLGLSPPRSTLPSQPKKETIRCDMATTSSKTVQPPQTQTHAWQAHLNQSQNSCPRFNLPLRRNVNPPGPLSLGLGSRGCTVGYVGFGRGYFIGEGG